MKKGYDMKYDIDMYDTHSTHAAVVAQLELLVAVANELARIADSLEEKK